MQMFLSILFQKFKETSQEDNWFLWMIDMFFEWQRTMPWMIRTTLLSFKAYGKRWCAPGISIFRTNTAFVQEFPSFFRCMWQDSAMLEKRKNLSFFFHGESIEFLCRSPKSARVLAVLGQEPNVVVYKKMEKEWFRASYYIPLRLSGWVLHSFDWNYLADFQKKNS